MFAKNKVSESLIEAVNKVIEKNVEQIDELSKSTLGSYAKKASFDATIKRKIGGDFEHMAKTSRKPDYKDAATRQADKWKDMARQRKAGVEKAIDRLSKEEVEQMDEGGMPSSVIKNKQRNANMSDKDFANAHKDKSDADLKSMAWRHGYGKDSSHYVDRRNRGQQGVQEDVESVEENAFTDYKTDKKPSIFAPKSHTAKKISTGTMYSKNWSKKDQEHKTDEKQKNVKENDDCVTKPEAKDIAKKEVKGHEKRMHKESFALKLIEKYNSKYEEIEMGEEDMNEMSEKQKAKREKIVMAMKDKTDNFKKKYGKRWKEVMYATATKTAMNEDIESLDEGKMDHMSLSHLWHAHAKHSYGADQGWGGGQGGQHSHHAATAIENHVRKHYGNKVADDMVAHSDHHVAHAEYVGGKESKKVEANAEKLRKKHGIEGDLYGHRLHEQSLLSKIKSQIGMHEAKDPNMDAGVGSEPNQAQNANTTSDPVIKKQKNIK